MTKFRSSLEDYESLIKLNNHIDIYLKKIKRNFTLIKKKKNDKKKLKNNAKKTDSF